MNADNGLTLGERFLWMVSATIKYLSSTFVSRNTRKRKNLKVHNFFSVNRASPTRMYTENLIYNLIPWEKIKQEKGVVSICEFGCGNLRYLELYDEVLGKDNYHYLGIEAPGFQLDDCAKRRLSDKVKFINFDLNNGVPNDIEEYNVFVSFSVLEHIDNLDCMLKQYQKLSNSGSLHFHSVPTFLSVINYLWHGCRHFNKKDINRITAPGDPDTSEVVYYGGLLSIILHLFFITTLDVASKMVKLSGTSRSKGDALARGFAARFQAVDDLTAQLGIHSFVMVSWINK